MLGVQHTMINCKMSLENPWAKQRRQVDFFCRDYKLSTHKNVEVQLTWFGWQTLLELDIDILWRGRDHAGPRLQVTLLGMSIIVSCYDGRHWNYDENRWYRPGDEDDTDAG